MCWHKEQETNKELTVKHVVWYCHNTYLDRDSSGANREENSSVLDLLQPRSEFLSCLMIFSCTSDLSISENQPFPSSIIVLAVEIVLFQYFRVVRPAIPIIDHKLDAEVLRYNGKRSHLMFLSHKIVQILLD